MKKKKLSIKIVSFLSLIILIFYAVTIPMNMTDGTENFHGEEKNFAERTMQFIDWNNRRDLHDSFFYIFFTKAKVENVIYTPQLCKYSKYSAIVSHRTAFGIKADEYKVSGCQMDGDRGDF